MFVFLLYLISFHIKEGKKHKNMRGSVFNKTLAGFLRISRKNFNPVGSFQSKGEEIS